jgi:hypothetical protein
MAIWWYIYAGEGSKVEIPIDRCQRSGLDDVSSTTQFGVVGLCQLQSPVKFIIFGHTGRSATIIKHQGGLSKSNLSAVMADSALEYYVSLPPTMVVVSAAHTASPMPADGKKFYDRLEAYIIHSWCRFRSSAVALLPVKDLNDPMNVSG